MTTQTMIAQEGRYMVENIRYEPKNRSDPNSSGFTKVAASGMFCLQFVNFFKRPLSLLGHCKVYVNNNKKKGLYAITIVML